MSRIHYPEVLEPGQAPSKRRRYNENSGDFERGSDDNAGGALYHKKRQQYSGIPPGGPHSQDAVFMSDVLRKQEGGITGVVHSTGRHDPTTKQSTINQTCYFSSSLYDARAQTLPEDSLAPLGTRKDHMLYAGSWVFSLVEAGASRANVRRGVGGFGEREIFDCVNGLDRRAKLGFVGLSVTQTDSTDVNARLDCTVTVAGTVTGINTGPFAIKAGQLFGFLWTPFTVVDHGVPRPGIAIDGVPKGKYMPMTVPMDDIASPEVVQRAINIAADQSEWKGDGDVGDFEKAWRKARQQMRVVIFNDSLQDSGISADDDLMPIDILLAWHMLEFNNWNVDVANLIEDAQMRMARVTQNSELQVEDRIKWTATFPAKKQKRLLELRKAQCTVNHRSWVASHVAGKAMNTSPPGKQLDAMLGYFTV